MLDVWIKNAKIIDGSGAPAFEGNVGIRDGKFVMDRGNEEAKEVIVSS